MDVQLVAQACAILGTFLWASLRVAAYIPYALAIISLRTVAPWLFPPPTGAAFYKGTVLHVRKRPKHNAFSYPVRMALIDLDAPPTWWSSSANDNMTAEAARQFAGTSGKYPTTALADMLSTALSCFVGAGPCNNPWSTMHLLSS